MLFPPKNKQDEEVVPISYLSLAFGKSIRCLFHVPEVLPRSWKGSNQKTVKLINFGALIHAAVAIPLRAPKRKGRGPPGAENTEFSLDILCLPYSYGSSKGYMCVFYRNSLYDGHRVIMKDNPETYGYLFD